MEYGLTIKLLRTKPARFDSLEDAAKKFKAKNPNLAGLVDDRLNILDEQLKRILPADENEAKKKEKNIRFLVDAFMRHTPVREFDYFAGVEFIKAEIYGREWEKEEERPNKFYLADEQVRHLAEGIRNICKDGDKRRLFEIATTYLWKSINAIAIDGFTVGEKEKINLVDWANSSIVLMPIPSEEYLTPYYYDDVSPAEKKAWKESWDEKILGLVNEHGEIIKTAESRKIAQDIFMDISFCIWYLRACPYALGTVEVAGVSGYLEATLMAAEIYGRLFDMDSALRNQVRERIGRRRIEDWPNNAPQLMAVRNAVENFRNSDREKIKREIVYAEECKPETAEKWMVEVERRDGITIGENSKKLIPHSNK